MKSKLIPALLMAVFVIGTTATVFAHCQIPCGIYGDKMRFDMWSEQITTIEKSMKQIIELSKAEPVNYNQIVRWVNNKDKHADDIMQIALQYFLAQRIKPAADANDKAANEKYAAQLQTVHHIIVQAMRAKQTTDLEHVQRLRTLVRQLYKLYFEEEMEDHLKEHSN